MRWIVRIVVASLLLFAAWLANIHFGWLPRPTTEQRAALARLREPQPPLGERNAFAALWFIARDVPLESVDELMREELAAWRSAPVTGRFDSPDKAPVATRFPLLDAPGEDSGLCDLRATDCLAAVRRNPEHFRTLLQSFERHRIRVLELSRYDHVAYAFPPAQDLPFPNLAHMKGSVLTHAALLAVDGRHDEALAETCGYAATWRRLRAHADTLLLDMFATAYASAAAQLAAQIVADAPAVEWTDDCARAFAPLSLSEIGVCAEMRYEFGFLEKLVPSLDKPQPWTWAINTSHVLAKSAPRYAALCYVASAENRRIPRDEVLDCERAEWVIDPFGCAFIEDGEESRAQFGAFSDYRDRLIDLDGQFAALRTAVWLRDEPISPGSAFELRRAALRTSEHHVEIDTAAGTLTLVCVQAGRAPWTIPFARRSTTPAP